MDMPEGECVALSGLVRSSAIQEPVAIVVVPNSQPRLTFPADSATFVRESGAAAGWSEAATCRREARVAKGGTIRVFDFDFGTGGARVVVAREPIGRGCLSEGEVDVDIRLLKEDLDRVAGQMKRAIREKRAKPLFGD